LNDEALVEAIDTFEILTGVVIPTSIRIFSTSICGSVVLLDDKFVSGEPLAAAAAASAFLELFISQELKPYDWQKYESNLFKKKQETYSSFADSV